MTPPSCFLAGTKILCNINNNDIYIPIENITKNIFVKTHQYGYVQVYNIGKSTINNIITDKKTGNQLYICKTKKYPELIEDLYITGYHSILVDNLTESQKNKTLDECNDIYITGNKYRLFAFLDERTTQYNCQGEFEIWHIALKNESNYKNYGIFANGLLVESCDINTINTKMKLLL